MKLPGFRHCVWVALVGCLWTAGVRAQDQPPPAPPAPVLPRDIVQNGPPANRPADNPGPPPADGLFYVPGEFVPQNAQVSWREGYWTREQPGWTWIPARWVRLSSGWTFIDGSWQRQGGGVVPQRSQTPVVNDPARRPVELDTGDVVLSDTTPTVVTTSTAPTIVRTSRLAVVSPSVPATFVAPYPAMGGFILPQYGVGGFGPGLLGNFGPVVNVGWGAPMWNGGFGWGGLGWGAPGWGGWGGWGWGGGLGWGGWGMTRVGFGMRGFGFGFGRWGGWW